MLSVQTYAGKMILQLVFQEYFRIKKGADEKIGMGLSWLLLGTLWATSVCAQEKQLDGHWDARLTNREDHG